MSELPPLSELVPHEPPMRLLDALVACDETHVRCAATLDAGCVLARDDGTLDAVIGLELMAQCAAVHAGLQARGAPRVGYLVSCRELVLEVATLPAGARLEIEVEATSGASAQAMRGYRGQVLAPDGACLVRATFAVYLTPEEGSP